MKIDRAPFRFKQFSIHQANSPLKLGTDGVMLGVWAHHPNPKRILDIGTGTGIIALMQAQKYPEAEVLAIDINPNSLMDARLNFKLSPWKHRLKAEEARAQEFTTDQAFDLIITNPPYFTEETKSESLEKDMARHQDSLSLGDIFAVSSRIMHENSLLQLIIPSSQKRDAIWEASLKEFYPTECTYLVTALGKPAERVMLSFRKAYQSAIAEDELHIHQEAKWEEILKWRRLKQCFYL